jgi:hypothetical protein
LLSIFNIQERCWDLPSILEVDEPIELWRFMADAWSSPELHKTTIEIEMTWLDGLSLFCISLITLMSILEISLPTLKQRRGITLKQTSASDTKKLVLSFAELARLRRKMAALCLLSES